MKLLLKNGKIITADNSYKGDIFIENGAPVVSVQLELAIITALVDSKSSS